MAVFFVLLIWNLFIILINISNGIIYSEANEDIKVTNEAKKPNSSENDSKSFRKTDI